MVTRVHYIYFYNRHSKVTRDLQIPKDFFKLVFISLNCCQFYSNLQLYNFATRSQPYTLCHELSSKAYKPLDSIPGIKLVCLCRKKRIIAVQDKSLLPDIWMVSVTAGPGLPSVYCKISSMSVPRATFIKHTSSS